MPPSLTVFRETTPRGPPVWADTATQTGDRHQWRRGRTHPHRFYHETWKRYTADVLLNTDLSPPNFILFLSLKYVKLTAVVVFTNMSSSLGRGLQHFLVFSSHLNSTWWKAIQIIKRVSFFILLLCFSKMDLRSRSGQMLTTAPTHGVRWHS